MNKYQREAHEEAKRNLENIHSYINKVMRPGMSYSLNLDNSCPQNYNV